MDDILIRGGQVIDGTGAPARAADVAIRAGRIVAIEANRADSADRVIDAHGSVVAPGFIDIHTHSDFTLPLNPRAEGKIRQGVTTEVVGNCGFSVAPALPGKVDALSEYLSGSAPWLTFEETDFARYMDSWPDIAVNTVMQVGHNTLRLMAMGMENRAPREAELRHMQDMLDGGACSRRARPVVRPVHRAGLLQRARRAARPRSRAESPRRTLLLPHPRRIPCRARGRRRSDRHRRALRRPCADRPHEARPVPTAGARPIAFSASIDAARSARRRRRTATSIPMIGPPTRCASCCRPGCMRAAFRRCWNASPILMSARASGRRSPRSASTISARSNSWADIRIAISPHGAAEAGRTIEEIARERRCDPLDAVCDVIIADKGATRILVRSMSEADVRAIAADPSALVGSDGPCVAPYGVTGQGKPHPRLYGTFPRLIGHYARDLGLLTLPQAIAKMTGGAAAALGLADRGLLRKARRPTWSCSTPQRSSIGRPTTTRTSIRRASGR